MKRGRFLTVTMGALMLGGLLVAACDSADSPAEAQGVLADLPGVTQNRDKALAAAQRFVILPAFNSDAVLDKETGLVWEKSPQTTAVSSANVRLTCANKAVGGRKGWRLPSLTELASLVDPSVASPGPTLPPGHPFMAVQSANYWSGSAHAENPALMWGVGFGNGAVLGLSKAFDQRAWCVRSGTNAE